MENVEIARVLNHYADLLDIEDENPFRVRSGVPSDCRWVVHGVSC
jgi:DNA polymerase/3'-5' exonuclease PolX